MVEQEMYFEDFYRGQTFESLRSYRVTAREIVAFGEKYDPQSFQIDEAAGKNYFFGGLTASGWLTAAIVMRLRVESINVGGGMIGAGVEEMRWTHPVRPDDRLRTWRKCSPPPPRQPAGFRPHPLQDDDLQPER